MDNITILRPLCKSFFYSTGFDDSAAQTESEFAEHARHSLRHGREKDADLHFAGRCDGGGSGDGVWEDDAIEYSGY